MVLYDILIHIRKTSTVIRRMQHWNESFQKYQKGERFMCVCGDGEIGQIKNS